MNKTITPLKIVTPKNKPFTLSNPHGFYTLDVNGRSYSPENLEQSTANDPDPMSLTMGSIYESKKFKVRTTSNFINTTRNWRNMPYQRIRKVQNAINQQKQIQRQAYSERAKCVNAHFDSMSPSLSPKIIDRQLKLKEVWDFRTKVQAQRLKQIQQIIKSSRQQSSQRKNIIRFQHKLNCLEANQVVLIKEGREFNSSKQEGRLARINKVSVYADVVKNRRKLSEKRHTRKKVSDHSLLGRINCLQNSQQISFVLRNSFDKSRVFQDQ